MEVQILFFFSQKCRFITSRLPEKSHHEILEASIWKQAGQGVSDKNGIVIQ